jgi:hypothetical protein
LQRVLSFPDDFPSNHYASIPKFTQLPTMLSSSTKIKFTNNLMKVTIVRHPFVRITSTYQDKVIDNYGKKGHFQTALIKFTSIEVYRGFPIKFRVCELIKNFFNNRGNLNFWCLGEGQVSYLSIDQKFIGVVSTETEI